ncbi:helix-turn-helix domain-containing protein (plasmid) [Entomospira nematocerorum]|uniref:Helix-turn-helix domain-containing protein n=1 Tax=Entomospira nematocerorum TaxID=2719987 RepID=A0A968KVX0_9SPIO|nr:helix-turn-helix domain-containing protein [Entomospira nematocera]NIZ47793.1 helix-turn-helix domain-containing protein [Entomospira nematocera]WDI34771.1 helix-turn-helix domain-containing protein [Entomospira nematocera]
MTLLSGEKLAKELGTTGAQISRLKSSGYIQYYQDTTKFELESARQSWQEYQAIKSGELLNLSQVAEYLGTSKSSITQMSQRGKLQVVAVGTKEVFYRYKDVKELKESREASPARRNESENPDIKEVELQILLVKLESEQLKLAEYKKEIMPIKVVHQMIESLMHKFDEMVESLPARLVYQIQHCQSDEERRRRIKEELEKFVNSLTRFIAESKEGSHGDR